MPLTKRQGAALLKGPCATLAETNSAGEAQDGLWRFRTGTHTEGTNMVKKLSLLVAAVAVLAFAVPAMASASALTNPGGGGELTAVGTAITGTGSNVVLKSSTLGEIKCETLTLSGKVVKNSGGEVEGSASNENPPTKNCKNGEKTVVVTKVELTKLFTSTSGSGTANFVAKIDVGSTACTFTGTSVPFTYTPKTTTGVITFTSAGGVSGGACGTAPLTGSFILKSSLGALTLD